MLGADFGQFDGTGYGDNVNNVNFDMQMGSGQSYASAYDPNGNILQMQHWGLDGLTSRQIDDLYYSYDVNTGNTNRLLEVFDLSPRSATGTNLGDFKNGYYLPWGTGAAEWSIAGYAYDDNGNLVSDLNKGLYEDLTEYNLPNDGIKYNYLNLPQVIYKHKEDHDLNPLQGTIKYLYDALGNKLEKIVDEEPSSVNNNQRKITTTTYLGEFTYENNQLQFITHEEGRFRPLATAPLTWVADYMLKDHLGNVRALLTDEVQQQSYPAATLEGSVSDNTSAVAVEKDYYQINAANVVPKATALDIPEYENNNGNPPYNNPNGNPAANSDQLYRLNANNASAKMGLGITLKVMAGDEVKILGKSYWKTASGTGVTDTPDPIGILDLLSAFVGNTPAASGKGVTGSALNATSGVASALTQFLGSRQQTSTQPQAYINWILFDERFQPVLQGTNSGFSPVGEEGVLTDHRQAGGDFLTTGTFEKSGYLYVYCSNESKVDVFFDNLQVVHNKGPLLEETHYYPFGLTMAGISSKAAGEAENKNNKFQNQELNNDLGVNYYEFRWRTHDPQIGRFLQIDPLADKYRYNSPYAFSENKVVVHRELEGLEAWNVNNPDGSITTINGAYASQSDAQAAYNTNYRWWHSVRGENLNVGADGMITSNHIKSNRQLQASERGPLNNVTAIVLHRTQGSNVSGALSGMKSRNLGVHFIIDKDGTVMQLASLNFWLYHVGKAKHTDWPYGSTNTIGIEHVGTYDEETETWEDLTVAQKVSSAWLVKSLMSRYDVHPFYVIPHEDLSYKTAGEGQTIRDAIWQFIYAVSNNQQNNATADPAHPTTPPPVTPPAPPPIPAPRPAF